MKKNILFFLSIILTFSTIKSEEARLLRFPAINQDQIVFSYAGDLYSVAHEGGLAQRLTSHEGLEIFPRFSKDGKNIAFTGQYDGNTEVYLIPAQGGIPIRLTHTSTLSRDDLADRMGPNNVVMGWTANNEIVYRSRRYSFNSFKGQLFKVSSEGGLSTQIELPEGGFLSFSPDGKKMAYNRVFREFRTWKYYQGGMADDIWIHDFETKETYKITDHPGQDIIPMWIGEEIFFLSDRDRTMNLFAYNTKTRSTEKITQFEDYDIKFPSSFQDMIVFEKGGYIFKMDAKTRKYEKVSIHIKNDMNSSRAARINTSNKIYSASLSPGGERILFSARGELFSLPSENGISYNLTRSSGIHERDGTWSPDGKQIAWLSDKSGEYEIWVNDVYGENQPRQLTNNGDTYKFNIEWSPNSEMIAWNDQNFDLNITELTSGNTKKIASNTLAPLNDFEWSPDSKWLTYTHWDDNKMGVVCVVNIKTGETYRITDNWYDSQYPTFSDDGNYLLFVSDRSFNPIYSNTEWNHAYVNMSKVYLAILNEDLPSPLAPKNDEIKLEENNKDDNEAEGAEGTKDLSIDFFGIKDRIIELPIEPAIYYNISCVKNKVYYNRIFQAGKSGNGLLMYDLDKKEEKFLGEYRYTISEDKNKMLLEKSNQWSVVDLPLAPVSFDKTVDLSNMTTMVNFHEEWQQIFDEVWRQMRDFFYVDSMHGVDWMEIYKKYVPLVKHVNHRTDLNYVIGEMVGELNVGHAYINPGEQKGIKRINTGLLGAKLSLHESGYFKIDKILNGASWNNQLKSPLQAPGLKIREGDFILAVNRMPTTSVSDIYTLLQGTAGKTVEITVNSSPDTKGARQLLITPIADESGLYYNEWVKGNIKKVEEATDGQVGYLHIPDMSAEGLNEFVKYFYPQLNKKALIIDDRGNGGGNVSPMILERLSRVAYRVNMRRNSQKVSPVPAQTFIGPMVTLIDKYSASDGDLFAHGFKELKLGLLIGTQTWGGVVGITGSLPFIDGTDLRIPQFTSLSMKGDWIIEGIGVEPDIYVENDPYKEFMGEDEQLNKAIEVMLEELKQRKELPTIPDAPIKN